MAHPAKLFFSSGHPLFSMFDVEYIHASPLKLSMKFIALKEFVDDVDTDHLHSGFSTLILDSVMGGSVMGALDKMQLIATINLSTQHSNRALLDEPILCTGQVENIKDQVAIATGQVICMKNSEMIANAIGSFMIGTRSTPLSSSDNGQNKIDNSQQRRKIQSPYAMDQNATDQV